MYGLVNKAIQDMVCTHFGEEAWQQIRQQAEVEEQFVNIKSYHDNVTTDSSRQQALFLAYLKRK